MCELWGHGQWQQHYTCLYIKSTTRHSAHELTACFLSPSLEDFYEPQHHHQLFFILFIKFLYTILYS